MSVFFIKLLLYYIHSAKQFQVLQFWWIVVF